MSDTVGVTHVGLWQRILLFFCPPKTVQANCFDQPWVGVTEEWCGRVSARFEQQERRAAAIAMLEKEAAKLLDKVQRDAKHAEFKKRVHGGK